MPFNNRGVTCFIRSLRASNTKQLLRAASKMNLVIN
jgi:hypothetical protein